MRKFIVTFALEQETGKDIWRTVGNVTNIIETKNLPIKYSELKEFVQKTLSDHLRVKNLQSICDVTDLVEFDE